jgi:ferredoxin
MKKKKKRLHPLHRIRIIVSVLAAGSLTAVFFLRPGISGRAAELQTFAYKTQFIPSVLRSTAAGAAGAAAVAFIIIASTFFFGRAYCSSLCPLGTLQDAAFRLTPRRRNNMFRRRRWKTVLRFSILIAAGGLAAAGFSLLLAVIEPFSIFSRVAADFLRPAVNRLIIGISSIFQAVGVYIEAEPLLFTFGSALFGFGLAAGILTAAIFRGRWFCNTVCPAGTVFSLPAAVSLWRIVIDPETCTRCGLCERNCKAGCIDASAMRVDAADCVLCFACLSVCPYDAISYRLSRRADSRAGTGFPAHRDADADRRKFLSSAGRGALLVGGLLLFPFGRAEAGDWLPKRLLTDGAGAGGGPDEIRIVLPPGAVDVRRYFSRCVQCHVCVSKCPQQVLVPAALTLGAAAAGKPVMDYGRSFCEFECTVCTRVCPAGALQPLEPAEKKATRIGTAAVEEELCVVFTDGTACGACAEICPTTAAFMVPYIGTLTAPEVTPEVCIGCGACELVCPVEGIKAIRVTGLASHETAQVREHLPSRAARDETVGQPDEKQDDPFAF